MKVFVLFRIDKDSSYGGHDETNLTGVFSSKEKVEKFMLDNPLNCGYSYGSYWDVEETEVDKLESK